MPSNVAEARIKITELPEWADLVSLLRIPDQLSVAQTMTGTLPTSDVLNFRSPLSISSLVAEIEAEQVLVAANRELIHRMEAKVRATIDRVWGKSVENSG